MKKIMFLLIGILFVFVTFAFAQEEKITISTYYPSPYGVYKTLRIFPSDDIDIGAPCQNDGEVIYDDSENRAYICSNGAWTALGGGGGGEGGAVECVWVTDKQPKGRCLGCVHLKAYCPAGYTVVGGGGSCGKWLNYMYTSHPDRAANAWGVNCKGTCTGNNCSWNQNSYATALCCKNITMPSEAPPAEEPEVPPEEPPTGAGVGGWITPELGAPPGVCPAGTYCSNLSPSQQCQKRGYAAGTSTGRCAYVYPNGSMVEVSIFPHTFGQWSTGGWEYYVESCREKLVFQILCVGSASSSQGN
jgi:hypothetical protein